MNRKEFLYRSAAGATGLMIPGVLQLPSAASDPEQYKLSIVKEFVTAGHGIFDTVKSMLDDYPNLLYVAYDWGNGDYETALEGAGHVGNKEVANFLIEKGARANIFVMTMLGKTEIVKPVLEAFPHLINARGPHGLSLLHHAKKGGKDAEELLHYIESKGLTEMMFKIK